MSTYVNTQICVYGKIYVTLRKHVKCKKIRSNPASVIELHSSDQTLVGKGLRGCGVVFCEKGQELFASAVTSVHNAMSEFMVEALYTMT